MSHDRPLHERVKPVGWLRAPLRRWFFGLFRNAWQIASIAPDGRGLAMWSGVQRDEDANHAYGGAFAADGSLYANYFPTHNMTEAAGFGGIRRYTRGPQGYVPINGITTTSSLIGMSGVESSANVAAWALMIRSCKRACSSAARLRSVRSCATPMKRC